MSFLTEQGMTLLIMRSRKPIARRFQEWVCTVISEIRKTGEYRLLDQIAERDSELADKDALIKTLTEDHETSLKKALFEANRRAIRDIFAATHSVLIDVHRKPANVVYIGFIRLHGDDNKLLVKIGNTGNLAERVVSLKASYGEFLLTGVYPCDRHVDFEKRFMLTHPFVTALHCFDEPDHENCMELFLVSQAELDEIKRIASAHVHKYVNPRPPAILASTTAPTEPLRPEPAVVIVRSSVPESPNGFRVQRYSEDGKTLLAVYDTWVEARLDPAVQITNRRPPSAQKMSESVASRRPVRGFRWATIPRDLLADTVQDIGETNHSHKYVKGLIASLDANGRIIAVYPTAKDAALGLGKAGPAISKALHSTGKGHGYMVRLWDDCSQEQRDEWTKYHDLPAPQDCTSVKARAIEKLDPTTGEVVDRYETIKKALDAIGTSNYGCINDALQKDCLYARYRWRYAVSA